MMGENGQQLTVPPGFRFHPTDEELLYYYLRKKVSYEAIELDVIREVDLNKLEPWDLKDKCRIGCGHQNEWYFFSHKDKKYPTGTRTNRATSAGFWKATGRDKAIHMAANHSKRIGMRKTLVFYTGRAPHGQKTDWIMHEYRLEDHNNPEQLLQEDGWVVCRVFKKKSQKAAEVCEEQYLLDYYDDAHTTKVGISSCTNSAAAQGGGGMLIGELKINDMEDQPYNNNNNNNNNNNSNNNNNDYRFDGCMQLPQLFSPESSSVACPILQLSTTTTPMISLNAAVPAAECPQNMSWRLNTDWSFLNRLLAASDQQSAPTKSTISSSDHHLIIPSHPNSTKFSFPFPYPYPLPSAADFIKFNSIS